MDKSKLDFCIEALVFLVITALAGLGLLIKYILIPGREAWAKYGRQMEITWLGLDRHACIEAQLYLVFLLLGLAILYVMLQRKVILSLLTRFIPQHFSRIGVASIFLVVAMTLLALPLLATPEINEVGIREDLGLQAASSGMEKSLFSTADPEALGKKPAIGPAGQEAAEVEWAKKGSQVKVAHKKSRSSYWPKSPKYPTIYSHNLAEHNSFPRSQKRTTSLLPRCQPPGRHRSLNNKDIGG